MMPTGPFYIVPLDPSTSVEYLVIENFAAESFDLVVSPAGWTAMTGRLQTVA